MNESCEFDCTDDWLLWKEMKKHDCKFFHVPKCDVEHIHNVTIKERFISYIQSGWNARHIGLNDNILGLDLDYNIHLLHRELLKASRKLNRRKALFLSIEQIGPQVGQLLYENQIELNDMYSAKKIFEHVFAKRNLSIPDFDSIEVNLKKSNLVNLFRLYGKNGFKHLKNKLISK